MVKFSELCKHFKATGVFALERREGRGKLKN